MTEIEKALEVIEVITRYIDLECSLNEDLENSFPIIKEALEKQIPKKPINISVPQYDVKIGCCISCGQWNNIYKKFCPNCGQAIDWSVEECV